MRHLLVDADLRGAEGPIALGREDNHRLSRVLRLRGGEQVTLCDGRGHIVACTWHHDGAHPQGPATHTPRPQPRVELAVGLLKGTRWDWLIEKCVEVGADRIAPLELQHNVVRLREDQQPSRTERWHAIAKGALEQSGRAWMPEIAAPERLEDWLSVAPDAPLAFGDERPGAIAIGRWVRKMRRAEHLRMVVGPEGGLDETERRLLRAAGATAVALSDAVLRAETAALAAVLALRSAHDPDERL